MLVRPFAGQIDTFHVCQASRDCESVCYLYDLVLDGLLEEQKISVL